MGGGERGVGRAQFTIPDSIPDFRYKCCDLESWRRLIRLLTNCPVKSPQNENSTKP
jgi:hypothetical protein